MKKLLNPKPTLLIAVFATFIFVAAPVLAVSNDANDDSVSSSLEQRKEQRQEQRDKIKTKLTEVRLKNCQRHEDRINTITSRIAERGQKHLDVFNKIVERVENFYTTKGKVLSNYDELVANVNSKKATAQTNIDNVKSSGQSFACDGSDPKGTISLFKEKVKTMISSLKEYKTATRKLIVGVKSVQGSASSTSDSSGRAQ